MADILIRTCWNHLNYQAPCGISYYAENQTNYVHDEGFGMEEWNFNVDELVDGNLYGYIRPNFSTLAGKNHNIWFYTKSPNNELYLVGEYRDAYFLMPHEREKLEENMVSSGILNHRINQVYKTLQAIPNFEGVTLDYVQGQFIGQNVFKLKVAPNNVHIYSQMKPFSEESWNEISPAKKLSKRYNGYNHIPNIGAFLKLLS